MAKHIEILMNYLEYERLWSSQEISTLMKLIRISPDLKSLFQFMSEKEKSVTKITKYGDAGKEDVVFVVPSADVHNSTSLKLREQIGEHPLIFVESSGPGFNYSHSCNAGITAALDEGFKWIILCNDDLIFKQKVDSLLEFVESSVEDSVLTPKNGVKEDKRYHGEEFSIFRSNALLLGLTVYNSRWSFDNNKISWPYVSSYLKNFQFFLRNMKYVIGVNNTAQTFEKISRRITNNIVNFADFGIFPAGILRKYQFDETYWNGSEDYDFALRLHKDKIPIRKIDFQVESIGSASLGRSGRKHIITLLNSLYFSYKTASIIA